MGIYFSRSEIINGKGSTDVVLKSTKATPLLIAIDGNIGGGKTTLIDRLSKSHECSGIIFLTEPITEEWGQIRDETDQTLFEMFCSDRKANAFPFQILVFASLVKMLRAARSVNYDSVVIMERSIVTSLKVFSAMLAKTGDIGKPLQ